jgi:Bacterial pre-peptidase C-terminal domain
MHNPKSNFRSSLCFFSLCSLCLCGSFSSGASPTVTGIVPRGGQRGTEVVLAVSGARLADAQEILCYSPGIEVTKLEAKDAAVTATVKIARDCRLGEHAFRVRCASGLSELKTFWVGALPVVAEKEPNNEFASPQPIPLNCTVQGTIDREDVDYFAVEAKKGQRISVEIEALRIATDMGVGVNFDPFIAILDAKRFELATSDDTPLLKQDGCLSVIAPADATYVVMVRETSYRGGPGAHYRLHVGTFPRPTAVYPTGGKAGEEVEVKFLGDPAGIITKKVKLPAAPEPAFVLHAEDAGGVSPSGVPFRVTDLPNVLEAEPNDAVAQATKGEAPCAFNGVIDKPGDIDFYRFTAKKGQVFDLHCYARRLGSPLDPVLYVYNAQGRALAGNDDIPGTPDSYLRFTAPADGEYLLSVTDHLKKGGPTYTYRVEVSPPRPRVDVAIPLFSLYSQDRQWVAVPRGNRYATLVTTTRRDMGGELLLEARGLPAKLTATAEPVPPYMGATPVVFEAAPDAPLAGALADFEAKPADPKHPPTASRFVLKSELVFGEPNLQTYWARTEAKAPVAVTEAVPFKVTIIEPKVPLVHGGSMNLKIVAERQNGFKGPITVYPIYNPPGVGSVGGVTIPDGQTECLFALNANGGAPVRKWKYVVWGVATVGNGPVWVSSQLATVEIAAPYLALQLERAMGEQGKTTTLFGKVRVGTPFPGTAKVKLIGLPPRVECPEVEITAESKELSFPLKLDPAAPAGSHKNLFCQVTVTQNGEPVVHNLGSSELRIDVPLAAKAAPPGNAPKAAPAPAAEKRLSRLEQLRKEQEEREKAAQKKDKD